MWSPAAGHHVHTSLEQPEGRASFAHTLSPLGAAEEAEPPHKPPWNKVKVKGSSDCSLFRLPAYRKEPEPAVEESAPNRESADVG